MNTHFYKSTGAMRECVVYGLRGSDGPEVRYIGQTVQRLPARLANHSHQARNRPHLPVSRWIASVIARGAQIEIFPLAQNAVWDATERVVISEWRKRGARLLNVTGGGAGVLGMKNTRRSEMNRHPDHIARVIASNKRRAGKPGSPHSEATKLKIRAAKTGTKMSEEARRKMSEAHQGRERGPLSAEHKAKLSAALKGRPSSAPSRAGIPTGPLSEAHRAAVSRALMGHGVSAETRAKISVARLAKGRNAVRS